MKTLKTLLFVVTLGVAALAEPVKILLPVQAPTLIAALMAMDGQDRVVSDNGVDRAVRIPFDFGKDTVRIRLAIRKNLLALKQAVEVFEQSRIGFVREVFGVDVLPNDEFQKQPEEKRAAVIAKTSGLLAPVELDLTLFLESDVTAFATAGVAGSVSVALEPLIAKKH